MSAKTEGIEIIDFDTKLFGFTVGKFTGEKLSFNEAEEIVKYCKDNKIRCLFLNLGIDDFASLSAATKTGFVISDVRVVFEKDLADFDPAMKIKVNGYSVDNNITSQDIPLLKSLGEEISRVSRFNFDTNFPPESRKKLYSIWMLNSINKQAADELLVAREIKMEKPIGVITCKKQQHHGEIVLMGVNKKHHHRGVATLILNHAFCFFKKEGFEKVKVATQASNIPAQRMYQKNGFLTESVSVLFHLWTQTETNNR